jgi:hypothetical protein
MELQTEQVPYFLPFKQDFNSSEPKIQVPNVPNKRDFKHFPVEAPTIIRLIRHKEFKIICFMPLLLKRNMFATGGLRD